MGFSVRVVPGLRVRVSSRGVRAGIGPRIARVHVGSGRPGVSTGFGPFGFYAPVGGSGSRSRSRGGGTATASSALVSAGRADKLGRMDAIASALNAILVLHTEEFAPAQRPVAAPAPAVDVTALRKSYIDAALKGISFFKRAARRAATADAVARADAAAAVETQRLAGVQQQEQYRLDQIWAALLANDSDTVMGQLAAAFEDNAAPAAPLSVDGAEATLAVLVPEEGAIPDQMPGVTAAGNPSLRKMTKKDHDAYVGVMVSGYLLATVKEAFAVAPGLESVRIIAVRSTGITAYGHHRGEAIAAAVIRREALAGVQWDSVSSRDILKDIAAELVLAERGANRALSPLDLSREPELAAVMEIIDFDELAEE